MRSEVGVGTTFSVFVPSTDKSICHALTDGNFEWTGEGTVLVVDDEDIIRELATNILEAANLNVIDAVDGQEAVDVYRERSAEIDLVVLDLTTPRLSGRQVCEQLRTIRKDVRIVLSSGYVEEDATHDLGDQGLVGFVHKPYPPSELLRAVKDSLT